jgi:hypothetical protein
MPLTTSYPTAAERFSNSCPCDFRSNLAAVFLFCVFLWSMIPDGWVDLRLRFLGNRFIIGWISFGQNLGASRVVFGQIWLIFGPLVFLFICQVRSFFCSFELLISVVQSVRVLLVGWSSSWAAALCASHPLSSCRPAIVGLWDPS